MLYTNLKEKKSWAQGVAREAAQIQLNKAALMKHGFFLKKIHNNANHRHGHGHT